MTIQTRRGILFWFVVCTFVLLQGVNGQQCLSTLTEESCIAKGCQVVKGSRCSSSSVPPPCSLTFNNQNNEECCDPEQTEDHVHYLGCMQPGYICMTQCMEHIADGSVYIIWEGCAFTSSDWEDVSESESCDSCFDLICPDQNTDGWVIWMIWIAVIMFACAMLILIVIGVSLLAALLRWKYNLSRGNVYSRMVSGVEISPTEIEMAERQTPAPVSVPPTRNHAYIPVVRTKDGNIAIQMKDGSVRVVTPEQYQKLYEVQNIKRQKMMKLMQLRAQQRAQQQAQYRAQQQAQQQVKAPTSD